MFRIRSIVPALIAVAFFSVISFAQTATTKSVLINTMAFMDEKAGITALVTAEKKVEAEFAMKIKALQDDNAKLQLIAADIAKMRQQPITPIIQSAMASKVSEGESLQRNIEFNKTDLEAEMNKRRDAVIGPISFDIGNAIIEYGKKNNYGAIFDASKLAESGVLLFAADSTDITKDFIAYYNARTASVPIAK